MYEKISEEVQKLRKTLGWSFEDFQMAFNVFVRYEYACRLFMNPKCDPLTQKDLDEKTDKYMFSEMTQAKKTRLIKRFISYLKWLERTDKQHG